MSEQKVSLSPIRMCILLLSIAHPLYPLILLSNRDEFLNRATANADWWDAPNQHILGGRDLERKECGTWLAITKQGRIAALTNFREEGDERKTKDKSRGGMVNAYLTSPPEKHEKPQEFARRLIEDVGVNDVGGFSMLFGELRAPSKGKDREGERFPGLSILSNRSASAEDLTTIATKPGETHGLSNSHFGDSSWPKVVLGENLLKEAIEADGQSNSHDQQSFIERLFSILSVDKLPKRREGEDWDTYVRQMRNSILIPPVGGPVVNHEPADRLASASGYDTPDHANVHVRAEVGGYGTQKQTVILVDQSGRVKFAERTLYSEHGRRLEDRDGERVFEFQIEEWEA